MKLLKISLLAITLFACTPENKPSQVGEPDSQLHDSQAPELVETGSLLPATTILPSGVLEIGSTEAPHTLLIFTEFHCGYCADFHREQLPRLIADYVDTKQLKLQIVPFVLRKYEHSTELAKAAYCATTQNKGLEVYKNLYDNQSYQSIELKAEAFNTCMASKQTIALLEEQKAWADELEVTLVPTFFLNGEKFVGLPYYADLRGRIENILDDLDS